MAIDVGLAAIDRASYGSVYTIIVADNPANAGGTIDHVEIFSDGTATYEVASFKYISGSYVFSTTGNVAGLVAASGFDEWDAPGDFTAFNIDLGDYIGVYWPSGNGPRRDTGTGTHCYYKAGDNIPCTNTTFAAYTALYSIWAEGVEAGGATLVVQDAGHGHTADNIALVQAHTLAVAEALHGHAVDLLVLTQGHLLAIQGALHSHSSDNIALTQAHILAVQDTWHGHHADNIVWVIEGDRVYPIRLPKRYADRYPARN